MGKLIIDGNSVYEIDEACMRKREEQKRQEARKRAMRQQEIQRERKNAEEQ